MQKINKLNEIIKSSKDESLIEKSLLELFKDQIEENTSWKHLVLGEEQFNALDDGFDFRLFGDILISVEQEGELDFIHYFDIVNMNSIKEKGLLVSYSKSKSVDEYRPDMGYGIYVVYGDCAYEMPDNIAELLLNRYEGNEEVGYVVGTYKGKYLECVNRYSHSGYYLLKEDVTLDMIKEIDSEYISGLAEDYYDYEVRGLY